MTSLRVDYFNSKKRARMVRECPYCGYTNNAPFSSEVIPNSAWKTFVEGQAERIVTKTRCRECKGEWRVIIS